MTNWARAIIALEPTLTYGVYKLIAAKRYKRIGWPHHEQLCAHSREPGQLLWVPADHDQIASAKEAAKAKPEDLLAIIPLIDPISQEKLQQIGSEKGFGQKKMLRFLKILEEEAKIHRHKIPRRGAKAAVGYSQSPEMEGRIMSANKVFRLSTIGECRRAYIHKRAPTFSEKNLGRFLECWQRILAIANIPTLKGFC